MLIMKSLTNGVASITLDVDGVVYPWTVGGLEGVADVPAHLEANADSYRQDIRNALTMGRVLVPITLEEAKAAAILQCEQGTEEYIVLPQNYPWTDQANITRHETARATAPPPALETMYTHEDFLTMCDFIDTARTVCDLGIRAFAVCGSMEDIGTVSALITSARECANLEELAPVMGQLETFITEHSGA